MAMSRKRQRELNRLKRSAEELWDEQRKAIEQASAVLRDARHQASNYAREEVGPRVRNAYDDRVRPAMSNLTGALGSALALLDVAKDPRLRRVMRQAGATASSLRGRTPVAPPKKSAGPGRYILIGLGAVAALSVAYAAWQTLREDDELWIEDLGDPGLDSDDGE